MQSFGRRDLLSIDPFLNKAAWRESLPHNQSCPGFKSFLLKDSLFFECMDFSGLVWGSIFTEVVRTLGLWSLAGSSCPPCTSTCSPSLACPGATASTTTTGSSVGWTAVLTFVLVGVVLGWIISGVLAKVQSRRFASQEDAQVQLTARAQLAALRYGRDWHGGGF